MNQDEPTQDQVVQGLTRAGLPPDRDLPDGPMWFNDYGAGALQDAYRAGWGDAAAARVEQEERSQEVLVNPHGAMRGDEGLEVQVFVPSEKASAALVSFSAEGKTVQAARLSQAVRDGDGTWVPLSAIKPGTSEEGAENPEQEPAASGLAEFLRWRYGVRPAAGSE